MYVYMHPDRDTKINQAQIPGTNNTRARSVFVNKPMETDPEPVRGRTSIAESESVWTKMFSRAMDMVSDTLKEVDDETIIDVAMTTICEEDEREIDLTALLADALVMYMQASGLDGPPNGIKPVIEMLDPPTIETAKTIGDSLSDVVKDENTSPFLRS
ncbi:uncharacterized protein Z519_11009 [Cladophialophora bantiana CBS 173.52]|uniref:Uncharacterized protein n=1 Tax=Cladophialophora bantiana (strain ATCC 10958 / CBS 173.52 / CDC B-1940 / NIH 8579) TaxID=1442370 RepID=A0A0D2HBZ6_CLAB1|nr:uncharacterized protein Z519_11009 [Cladophialophora bantiana CBS 173.52]KIW88440.1 hypothetical protein Z519_11009 [Cladophialophora bantiana CBS 173.52]